MSTPTNGSPESNGSDLPRYNPPTNQDPYAASGQTPHNGQPNNYGQNNDHGRSYSGQQPNGSGQKIKGTPPLWLGITLAVAGPLLGIIILIISVLGLGSTVNNIAESTPGSSQTLEADQDYWIMSDAGTSQVDSCSVYDPSSNSIAVNSDPSTSASTESNGQSWELVGTFTSTDAGDYSVYCSGLQTSNTYVVPAAMGGILGGVFGIIGGILLGGLLFLVGIVLIIINRVTASRRRREAGMA